jgi:predicted DNA-binding transcriptional regulator AlpA
VPNSIAQQAKRCPRQGRRLLRPKEIWTRLGCGHTKFYKDYVNTGLINLIDIGPGSVGCPEEEVDDLIDKIIKAARAKGRTGIRRPPGRVRKAETTQAADGGPEDRKATPSAHPSDPRGYR